MPVVKKPTTLDSTILFAGSGVFVGTSFDAPYGWATMVDIKMTNQTFPLSVPAYAEIEVSNDGINWYVFQGSLLSNYGAFEEKSWSIMVQMAAIHVRVVWVAGDQNVAILSEISEIIEQENSVRLLTTQSQVTLTNTFETTLVAADPNFFIDITDLIVSNTSGTDTTLDFRDSTGGTIRYSTGLKASSTEKIKFSSLLKQTTINNTWTVQSSNSVTDIRITTLAQLNT